MAHNEHWIQFIVVVLVSFCCAQMAQNLGSSSFNLFATCVRDGFDSELLSARLLFRVE